MADSFNKKEREKKRRKKKQEKAERKLQKKLEGPKPEVFMYVDEDGNLTPTPPDRSKRKEIKLEEIRVSTPKDSELEAEDTNKDGVVKFFNEEKRFGFIKEVLTGEDFFVHEEHLAEKVKEGDKVIFEIGNGPKGLVALNVRLAGKSKGSGKSPESEENRD